MSFSEYRKSDEQYSLRLGYFWIVVAGLSAIFGIVQTQWFVSRLHSASQQEIQQTIRDDFECQRQRAIECLRTHGLKQVGMRFHEGLFNETQRENLQEQYDTLLKDKELENVLKQSFGHSLREVNAVVLPAWQMHNDYNKDMTGLTDLGWAYAITHAGDPNVMGYTVRERPGNAAVTRDGASRIALNLEAFASKETLRLTLFHELLHAMNVPEFTPPRYCLLQTDLTYLAEYRWYVAQAGLESWHERSTWIFVFAPWVVFFVALYYVRRQRSRVKRLRMQSM